VYNLLADDVSKKVFLDILNFKISGKINYLSNTTSREDIYKMLNLTSTEHFVDLGAYNGDTVREFLKATGEKYSHITAFEPDSRNYKKLALFCENYPNTTCHNIGAHSHKDTLIFADRGGRNSSLFKEGRQIETQVNSVDNLCENPTVIKFDVEGAESLAITGCEKSIKQYKPKLLISAYHRNEDIFSLPLKVLSIRNDYKIYLRREKYIPAWEINYLFM
jgi:FkbM family methyltransferase